LLIPKIKLVPHPVFPTGNATREKNAVVIKPQMEPPKLLVARNTNHAAKELAAINSPPLASPPEIPQTLKRTVNTAHPLNTLTPSLV
jgi:hypothetical protein